MSEAQAQSRFKQTLKHQSPKMKNHTYSHGDMVLIWRAKIVYNRIDELIGPFTKIHHDERSKIVSIDQNGITKWYSSSQIRPFIEQPSELDDAIAERSIEDNRKQTQQDKGEPLQHEENVQLNVDPQSYGEHSVIDDCDSV